MDKQTFHERMEKHHREWETLLEELNRLNELKLNELKEIEEKNK